jgi:hypothetical protein
MSALIWQCIRDNHAFLKKGHGPKTLSAEVGNVTGVHNFKFSGLANSKVAGMTVVTKGKKASIRMSAKVTGGKTACPSKLFNTVGVSKSSKKAANCISKTLGVYRPDLVSAATAKYQKIKRSFRLRK